MKKLTSLLFLVLFGISLFAQKIDQQITFKIDNDQFVNTDRYYTSGIFFSYKKDLKDNFIFKKEEVSKTMLNFTVGNEIYTPTNLNSFDVTEFDRPYAGWLFGRLETGKIKKNSASFIAFETGITGKESLSGGLQVWLHDFLGFDDLLTWTDQIALKWLFNLQYRHLHGWELNKYSNIYMEVNPSIGTKDIFLENTIHYFFGRFNELKNSSRLGLIDATSTNEFYGLVSLGHRYVAHNTLIQGSLFEDDILFTTNIARHLLKFRFGGVYKNKRNTFKLIYNFNSKETPRSKSHGFGTFIYSRDF